MGETNYALCDVAYSISGNFGGSEIHGMVWYFFEIQGKYCYFPIIQSDAIFRERLKQALPLSVSLTKKYDLIGKKVILYVGRLVEVKNVSLLLKAFHDVIGKSPEARLFIVGDGELQAELKRQIRGYIYMHSVQFVGKQEGLDCSLITI